MMFSTALFTTLFITFLSLAAPARGFTGELPEAVRASSEAVGRKVGSHILTDQSGRKFNIDEILDKPLVVSYIYTSCSHTCPMIMTSLKNVFEAEGSGFGKEFRALTIGFDVKNDTPEALRAYGSHFTGDFAPWKFATADKRTMEELTRELGFYYRERAGGGYDHLNLVTVIDIEGRVSAQLWGTDFNSESLSSSVHRALSPSAGADKYITPVGVIDRVKYFCYRYDESTGTYRLDYGTIFALVAVMLTQAVVIWWVVHLIREKGPAEG